MQINEERRFFRDSLREFLEEEIAPDVDEKDDSALSKEEVIEYQTKMKEQLGIGFSPDVAEDYFGDLAFYGIGSEEISRVWPSLNVTLNMSFPAMFVEYASDETKDAMMGKLESGEIIGGLAVSEPKSGTDTVHLGTTARPDGDEYVLNGQKTWVSNAPIADVMLVAAHNEETDAREMFLVDQETSPFETSKLEKIGWKASPTGEVYLDDVRVPEDNNLSKMISNAVVEGNSLGEMLPYPDSVVDLFFELKPLNAIFAFMRTGMALMATGISQAALDDSIEYAKERESFGKKIGEHQLIQEKLYGMKAKTEASRRIAYHAIDLLGEADTDARLMSSLAKGYACEKCNEVTYEGIQIHGAMGLSEEYPLERYHRDARVMTIPDGTTEVQKLIVGNEMLGMSAYS
jgi:alkylation response protein AidB-like acyl-CoA dehydrogenase